MKRKKKPMDKGSLFDTFTPPSYEAIREKISKKLGKKNGIPTNVSKGVWSEQSLMVLNERYLQRDENNNVVETPEEMCWRVAWEVASAESFFGKGRREVKKIAKDFYELLVSHKFLPNSPTLMNAGTENNLQYSGCYVLPVGDSLLEIFDAVKYQAIIHQAGGGTGFSFSRLRPKGAIVRSSGGVASGPVSFMKIFDAATNQIKQGGKRRGANMGILRVDHPDILEFIHSKEEGGITNFNISVAITDKFMRAYERGGDYDLYDPKKDRTVGKLSAKKVFDEIAESAWRTGDPGIIFIDRMNKGSSCPTPFIGDIEATNPCGEQPLYSYDACNLGSVFLSYFVDEIGGRKQINWEELGKTVKLAVRFLDNVIQVNPYPLDEIRKTVFAIRRIGLGVGGWADMLVDLETPYDSSQALRLAEKVMKYVSERAIEATQELAKERGPFPMWSQSIYKDEKPRRNSTVTTIAPTGSISIIAGASSGIEPLFAVAYRHIVKDKSLDRTLIFVNPKFVEVVKDEGMWNEELREKIAKGGVVRNLSELSEEIREIFGTAHEIDPGWHIKMQGAFQKYTDNAVSKTINMKNDIKVQDVKEAYLLSWKTNCKGITVFRDGCKEMQVLNLGANDKSSNEGAGTVKVWKRPMKVSGVTYKIKTPVGTAFITVNSDDLGNPIEVFINVGRAGSDVQAMAEALGRLISKSLKLESTLSAKEKTVMIIDQLKGIGGRRSVGFGPNRIRSLPDAVAVALANNLGIKINGNGKSLGDKHLTNGEVHLGREQSAQLSIDEVTDGSETLHREEFSFYAKTAEVRGDICPNCGTGSLVFEEGCVKCYSCAYSEC